MSPLIVTLDFTPSPPPKQKKRQLKNKKKRKKILSNLGNCTGLINLHYPKLASWVSAPCSTNIPTAVPRQTDHQFTRNGDSPSAYNRLN